MMMKVGFFATCLVDLMRPRIGFAALRLLRRAGVEEVAVPPAQTCCGQPAYNGGYRAAARKLAVKCAAEFAGCDRVVVPSGSCAAIFRIHYPRLFADDEKEYPAVAAFAAKCRELCEFLEELNYAPSPASPACGGEVKGGRVAAGDDGKASAAMTYHDSCAGLRELGIKAAPRRLLAAAGVRLVEMQDAEECCGFGGTFAVKFGAISGRMAAVKCGNIRAAKVAAAAMGDLGCILSIEGRLRREGDSETRILHIAEALDEAAAGAPPARA